ncbi:UNVERIFIED_CONTAM: hypothetical protein NY603_40745, partial [Bacteroidetes bacterium 56_B9]
APSEMKLTDVPAGGADASVNVLLVPFVLVMVMVLPDSVTDLTLDSASPPRSTALLGVVLLLPTARPVIVVLETF